MKLQILERSRPQVRMRQSSGANQAVKWRKAPRLLNEPVAVQIAPVLGDPRTTSRT